MADLIKRYLRGAAKFKHYDYYRKEKKTRTCSLDQPIDENQTSLSDLIASSAPTPLETLLADERTTEVQQIFQKIKEEDSVLYEILIHRADKQTWEAIAEMMQRPQGSVASKFSRVRTKLKRRFGEFE